MEISTKLFARRWWLFFILVWYEIYWPRRDLNTQPSDLESDALPLRHEALKVIKNQVSTNDTRSQKIIITVFHIKSRSQSFHILTLLRCLTADMIVNSQPWCDYCNAVSGLSSINFFISLDFNTLIIYKFLKRIHSVRVRILLNTYKRSLDSF